MFIVTIIHYDDTVSLGKQWLFSSMNEAVDKVVDWLWETHGICENHDEIEDDCGFDGDGWSILIGMAESEE